MSPSSTSSSEHAVEGGLVEVPSGHPTERPRRRLGAIVVVVLFFALLAGTGLVDLLVPAPRPEPVGLEKVEEDRMRRRARFLDGTLAQLLEHDLRLTSRVRYAFGRTYTLFLFHYLDEAQGWVVVGRDGWLFLNGRTYLPDRADDDELLLARAVSSLAAVDRRLALYGVRLVVAPVPRKSVLYRDFLPRGVDPRPRLDEDVTARLAHQGIRTADLMDVLRRHRESVPGELLYFQSDSHWTEEAQVLAAEEICRAAGFRVPEDERRTRLVPRGLIPQERDHLEFIGLGDLEGAADVLELEGVASFDVALTQDGVETVLDRHKNPRSMPRIAVAGTSFTARRKLPLYLEHCSQERVWNAAQPGVHSLEAVRQMLVDNPGHLPRTLVLEIPNHNLFGRETLAETSELFASGPPPETDYVPLARLTRRREVRQGPVAVEDARIVARLPPGNLFHDGGGVAELRLQGRLRGRPLEVAVRHGDDVFRFPWQPGRHELVVPLVTAAPSTAPLVVSLVGDGEVTLKNADVVVAGDRGAAVAGQRQKLTATGDGGWRQGIFFAEAPPIPRHATFVLELGGREGRAGEPLELVVYAHGEPPPSLVFRIDALEAGTAVVDLGPLHGSRLASAEVRGQGEPPANVVAQALFLPLGEKSSSSLKP